MNITILGTGAYGLALALMFFRNKCSIKMWTKFDEEKEMLEENQKQAEDRYSYYQGLAGKKE